MVYIFELDRDIPAGKQNETETMNANIPPKNAKKLIVLPSVCLKMNTEKQAPLINPKSKDDEIQLRKLTLLNLFRIINRGPPKTKVKK